jgi:hypothetical protein
MKKRAKRPMGMSESRDEVSDILVRVTRAEERVVAMDARQEDWRDETRKAHTDLSVRLGKLENALQRYQGAWGLLTLISSAVLASIALFKDYVMRKFFS